MRSVRACVNVFVCTCVYMWFLSVLFLMRWKPFESCLCFFVPTKTNQHLLYFNKYNTKKRSEPQSSVKFVYFGRIIVHKANPKREVLVVRFWVGRWLLPLTHGFSGTVLSFSCLEAAAHFCRTECACVFLCVRVFTCVGSELLWPEAVFLPEVQACIYGNICHESKTS